MSSNVKKNEEPPRLTPLVKFSPSGNGIDGQLKKFPFAGSGLHRFRTWRQLRMTSLPPIRTNTLVAAAGEHYVLARLCLNGYIAALAPRGVPTFDIVVTDINGDHLFAVQVKARVKKGGDEGWPMNVKHEQIDSKNLLYFFMDFSAGVTAVPTTFIVPAATVARAVHICHELWLRRLGKGGRAHKDSDMRKFRHDYSDYLRNDCPAEYRSGWLDCYKEAWESLPK